MNKLDTVIDIAKDFIAIDSTTHNKVGVEEAITFIEDYLKRFRPSINFTTFKNGNNPSIIAYNSTDIPKNGFKVLLNGHLDVVSAHKEQFNLKVDGDKLIGRGAADMKISLIALLDSFTRITPSLSTPVALQISSDEEIGGKLGTGFQQEKGIATEFFMGGESTGLEIANEAKGVCQVRLFATTSPQHSAYQWEGRSLVDEASSIIQKIREIYPLLKNESWASTVTISGIQTDNTTLNKTPSSVSINMDIRYIPSDLNFKNRKSVEKFFKKVQGDFSLEIIELEPAHGIHTKKGQEYINKLQDAISKNTGQPAKTVRKSGASDARFYSHESAAILFGITGRGLHSDYEYASRKSLSTYIDILDDFLASLDS